MNFTQMHERLRQELLRRLQRGAVSVTLLSRQTGLAPAHVSNFLHGRRRLSLEALDRVLGAQQLTLTDLLPVTPRPQHYPADAERTLTPLVAASAALFEPIIRPATCLGLFPVPTQLLESLRTRCTPARRRWERFVAIRMPPADAFAMEPIVQPGSTLLLDRHYTSLLPYRTGRQNLYAIRHGSRMAIRYAEFQASRLVLRPHNPAFPVELIELPLAETPADYLAGRIALVANES